MKKNFLIFLVLVFASAATYSQGFISTIAGGTNGDGKVATDVGLNSISHIATDSAENIYFIDGGRQQVRKISASSGVVNTIAGTGAGGISGDGGNALLATFISPVGIATDVSANIYIVDNRANNIRKINAVTNTITTVAGSFTNNTQDGILATDAYLPLLKALTIDTAGNMYVITNNRIRKILFSTGIITTVAGNGTTGSGGNGGPATNAQLGNPNAIAVDRQGNIYIADNNNNVIRKIDAFTGIINIYAGNGTVGFSGDGGSAINAQLASPPDLSTDKLGNIYIVDNNRIRKISGGIINTIAGSATSGYNGDALPALSTFMANPNALTISMSGNIYYNDFSNKLIRKVRASDSIITTIAGNRTIGVSGIGGVAINAQLFAPESIAKDNANNIYLNDFSNNRIYKITNATGLITSVAGMDGGANNTDGIQATAAKISSPEGVIVDKAGNFYFIDNGLAIRKVNVTTGIITRVAGNGISYGYTGDRGPATSATINRANALSIDKWGNIYIADFENYCIRKVAASTGIITTVAGSGISGYSGDGGIATAAKLSLVYGVTVDNKGNIYIADYGNNVIRRVDSLTNIITTIAGNGTVGYNGDNIPATSATLNFPYGLTTDTTGNVYIADKRNNRIRKVTLATGIISTVAGNGNSLFNGDNIEATFASLNGSTALVIDSAGNFFTAEGGRVRKILYPSPISWLGTASSDWNNAANWSNNQIPGPTTTVTITAGTPYNPVISSGLDSAYNIQIANGASLTLNGGTFTIVNSISGTGVINGSSTANLVVSGSIGGNAGTLNFNPAFNKLNNLTVNRTGLGSAVTIGTPLTVQGKVNIAAGILYVSGIQMP